MGADDDRSCVEHVWLILGATLDSGGAHTDYECVRCRAVLLVPPGGTHPATA